MQPFSILLALGVLAGLVMIALRAPEKERLRYVDGGILTLIGALIGSRVVAVVVNWAYYVNHPGEIFQVWMGGLSGIGALIGGIIAVFILAILWRIPIGVLADAMLPLAGTVTIAAWLGCWVGSCSYGLPSTAWWAMPATDEWGIRNDRIPVQILGALLTLIVVWVIDRSISHYTTNGVGAAMGLLGISAVIFGLSYVRADPIQVWNGLRLDAWGALGLMIFSSMAVVVLLLRWKVHR
jgi:phosphatidylglycerol:prolipoprotein diacylglycerol transferase